jgi:hypothetical protein
VSVDVAVTGFIVVLLVWLVLWRVLEDRRARAARVLIQQIESTMHPLCCIVSEGARFQTVEINGKRSRWQPFMIAVMPSHIAVYRLPPDEEPCLIVTPDQLRWFGRPKKYGYGWNRIWLHAEIDGQWLLIKLRLGREPMRLLVRALKEIATPEQVTAYRRRRPYIHYGPITAQPATQDMLGAWSLDGPVSLYLMPLSLVVLDGTTVRQTVALAAIQGVSAIRRADRPGTAGLVRFEADGKPLAYALDSYETFATLLGEAARRTLENPVEWLGRKKKKSDEPDDDEEFS